MSSTRHAIPGGPLRQERYASSAEYDRGLLANLVAKRCSVLERPEDRELIWFIQYLSWNYGLERLAREILQRGRAGTKTMKQRAFKAGQFVEADLVKAIRIEIPNGEEKFLLKGELSYRENETVHSHKRIRDLYASEESALEREQREILSAAQARPAGYSLEAFAKVCDESACELENHLKAICLDPAMELDKADPWFFHGLIFELRKFQADWAAERQKQTAVTSLGAVLCDAMEYAWESREMRMAEGTPGSGKTFAGRRWCETFPGRARYVEVHPGNDDMGFFRGIAEQLGVSVNKNLKAAQLRDRVEEVLRTGDILLCLDECHRLWTATGIRYGTPARVNWLMAMFNNGALFFLISNPQFLDAQTQFEEVRRWNSLQWLKRFEFVELPQRLSQADLELVAKAALPEMGEKVWRGVAGFAEGSPKYLAAIDSIKRRAEYLAKRKGSGQVTKEEIRDAIQEKGESDLNLARAMARSRSRAKQVFSRKATPDQVDPDSGGALAVAPPRRGGSAGGPVQAGNRLSQQVGSSAEPELAN